MERPVPEARREMQAHLAVAQVGDGFDQRVALIEYESLNLQGADGRGSSPHRTEPIFVKAGTRFQESFPGRPRGFVSNRETRLSLLKSLGV